LRAEAAGLPRYTTGLLPRRHPILFRLSGVISGGGEELHPAFTAQWLSFKASTGWLFNSTRTLANSRTAIVLSRPIAGCGIGWRDMAANASRKVSGVF